MLPISTTKRPFACNLIVGGVLSDCGARHRNGRRKVRQPLPSARIISAVRSKDRPQPCPQSMVTFPTGRLLTASSISSIVSRPSDAMGKAGGDEERSSRAAGPLQLNWRTSSCGNAALTRKQCGCAIGSRERYCISRDRHARAHKRQRTAALIKQRAAFVERR
jgi:hypothetical protein